MRTKKISSNHESSMRTKKCSSNNEFSVFDFNEDEELIEISSRKLLGKYGKKRKKFGFDADPISKYSFLQCFAREGRNLLKDLMSNQNEPLDVDAVENVPEERISVLDAAATSYSSNHKPNTPIGIDSDDDGSPELCSSRFASSPLEGPLEVQLQEHVTGGCDISVVVLSPKLVIYGDLVSSNSQLTFSCSGIKLDGSHLYGAKDPFSFFWEVTDIRNINSQWCEQLETATLNLCLKSNDRKISKDVDSSGLMELKVDVYDPHWPKRLEEIKSLDVRYNDIWNVAFDIDAAGSEDVLLGQNSILRSNHNFVNELSLDESFEEVIYPKGDPDAVSISKRDVQRLQPDTFLNDTIIDFYILYLKNNVKPEDMNRFQFFNSFFFRKLADLDKDPSRACESTEAFKRVRKWTRKLDIFGKDYIFVPVNFSLHWSLIVICHLGEVVNFQDEEMGNNSAKVPCILHMDSIKGSHRGLENLIRSYLLEEWKERYNGPVEYASSKFLNLQFVPLEVPQQENSFDCGLFLLHYVELFLEQAPVNFSYSTISKSSKFLSKDWFPPTEASSKRGHIKRLIHKIVKDNAPKVNHSSVHDKYSSESLDEADGEEDTGLEFVLEVQSLGHKSCSDSDANRGSLDLTPTPAVSLRNGQYIRRSKLFDSDDNAAGSPTVTWNSQNSGQIVPLNFFKNVVSPIEEGEEEDEEQSAYSGKEESDKRVAQVTERLATETSEEHEKGSVTSESPKQEYRTECESCSSSSGEFVGLLVEDSEEENGVCEVIECETSSRPRRVMVEDSEVGNGGGDVIECESSPRLRIRVEDSQEVKKGDVVIDCESSPRSSRVEDSEEEKGRYDVIDCESSPRLRSWVEGSEEEKGGDDVIDCESSPRPRKRIVASSSSSSTCPHQEFKSIEKIDLSGNRTVVTVLGSHVEGAKRRRIMESG